jgi:hypothetical protein
MSSIPPELSQVTESLQEVAKRLDNVAGYGRRTRRLARMLIVTVFLDIALTITVAVLTANAIGHGKDVHRSQINACHAGNDTRADQVLLWRGLIAQFGPKHPSAAQKAKDVAFLAFVEKTFHPIDCIKLYGR